VRARDFLRSHHHQVSRRSIRQNFDAVEAVHTTQSTPGLRRAQRLDWLAALESGLALPASAAKVRVRIVLAVALATSCRVMIRAQTGNERFVRGAIVNTAARAIASAPTAPAPCYAPCVSS
jgi:hypothetical protein